MYLGTAITNRNEINDEIKRRICLLLFNSRTVINPSDFQE